MRPESKRELVKCCVLLLLRSVGGDGSRGGKEKSSRGCKENNN